MRKSILIIDDIQENLRLLVTLLQKEGYRVRPTRDGPRGLATAQAEVPDLILLDVKMPGMDGYEVCRHLKADERTREIPVIFLSALADVEDKLRGFEAGAVDYVTKPIEEAELLARVNTHLALRSMLQNATEMERHRALVQMVAGVAHELNTPLGIAGIAADMIAKRLSSTTLDTLLTHDPNLTQELHKMRKASELLTRNIANAYKLVQNFKKIAVNQLTEQPEAVELPQTVADVVELFALNARQAKLVIEIEDALAGSDPTWVGYPAHLTQILVNLLSNVERYAYPNGQGGRVEIRITGATVGGRPGFAVTVRDWGQGIPPQHVARIFEPFFTTGRIQGGTGLGMTIVHNIVTTVFKGHVHVESVWGQGTAVYLTFPRSVANG